MAITRSLHRPSGSAEAIRQHRRRRCACTELLGRLRRCVIHTKTTMRAGRWDPVITLLDLCSAVEDCRKVMLFVIGAKAFSRRGDNRGIADQMGKFVVPLG